MLYCAAGVSRGGKENVGTSWFVVIYVDTAVKLCFFSVHLL